MSETTHRSNSPSAVADFALQFALDARGGRPQPLSHYLSRYPGAEKAITHEYERLSKGAPESAILGLPQPGETVGAYRLTSRIGVGGQGVVFAAEDERLGRRVAVKFLHLTGSLDGVRLERFRREAEIISHLDHPGLCTIFDADLEGRLPYIVMPLLSGSPLSRYIRTASEGESPAPDWLKPEGREQLELLLAAFESVARALHAAHSAGIVHRDVKPGNLMCLVDGSLVVLDFGLARVVAVEDARVTRSGERFGTPAYMSPEQLAGGTVDRRSDVYSLAASLYECLTLEELHDAALDVDSRSVEVPQRLRRLRPRVPGASADLETVLEHALREEPERRYPDALVFAEELERLRLRHPILARPTSVLYRARKFVERNRRLVAATVTVIVALSMAAALAGWGLLQAKSTQANLERQVAAANKNRALEELRRGNGAAARALLHSRAGIVDSWEGRILAQWADDIAGALATGPVTRLAATADGKWLITLEAGHDAKVFDLESGQEMHSLGLEGFAEDQPAAGSLAELLVMEHCFLLLTPDDRGVVVLDGTHLWHIPDFTRPRPTRIPCVPVRSAALDPEGRHLGLYDLINGRLSVLELPSLSVVASSRARTTGGVIRFGPGGELLKLGSSNLESWNWKDASGEPTVKELNGSKRIWGPEASWYLEESGTGTRLVTIQGDILAEGEGSLATGKGPPFLRSGVAEPNGDFFATLRAGNLAVVPTAGLSQGISKVPYNRKMPSCFDGSGRLFRRVGDETLVLDVTRLESLALPFKGTPAVGSGPGTNCFRRAGVTIVFEGAALESARRVDLLTRSLLSATTSMTLDEMSADGGIYVRVGQLIRRHEDWFSVELHDLRRGTKWIRDLRARPSAQSIDDALVAIGTEAGAEVFHVEDGSALLSAPTIPGPVVNLRLANDGRTLFAVTGGVEPSLIRSDLTTGSIDWSTRLDALPRALAASPSSGWVAVSVGGDGRVDLFDAATGAASGRIRALAEVRDLDLHPGRESLLAVAARDRIQLFDLEHFSERLSLQSTLGSPSRIAFTRDGESLQYATSDFVASFGRTYDRRVALERHRVGGAVEFLRSLYETWFLLEDVLRELEVGICPGDAASRARELAPLFESPFDLNKRAWILATSTPIGDLHLALRYARRATLLRPDVARHWNTLALVLLELEDAEGAAAALDRTDEINRDDEEWTVPNELERSPYNLFLRTLIRLEQGQHEQALAEYREACRLIATEPYAPVSHYFRPWIERCHAKGGEAFEGPPEPD